MILISGGNIHDDFALDFLGQHKEEKIIAADKGLEFCHRHHIEMAGAVGDFDSALPEAVEYYKKKGVFIQQLPVCKDDSDTQSALHLAREWGADSLIILGALGTRMDHVWANVQMMAYGQSLGVDITLLDYYNKITLKTEPFTIEREDFGNYVSFYSLGDQVEGLTLKGFKYPLTNYLVKCGDAVITLSNEILEERGSVEFQKGRLLVMQTRD